MVVFAVVNAVDVAAVVVVVVAALAVVAVPLLLLYFLPFSEPLKWKLKFPSQAAKNFSQMGLGCQSQILLPQKIAIRKFYFFTQMAKVCIKFSKSHLSLLAAKSRFKTLNYL